MSVITSPHKLPKLHTIGEDTPVAYYELVQQGRSGFIEEGTERLPEPNEITAPSLVLLKRTSHYFKKDDQGIPRRVNIRYIHGVEEIDIQKQEERKFVPNPRADVIILKKGLIAVAREGSTIGLYDYLKKASYTETNPDRDPTAEVRIREVVPEQVSALSNSDDFLRADAINMVRALVKEESGSYKYNEPRLNAFTTLFGIAADQPGTKVRMLLDLANMQPKNFVDKVKLHDQRFEMEVLQAEELGVIKYGPNTAEYVAKAEIIHSYVGAFRSKDAKRAELVSYFQSEDGAVAYQKFLVELEAARQPKN